MDKAIVKVMIAGKVLSQHTFAGSHYVEDSLKFVQKKIDNGFTCLVLKQVNDKTWSRIMYYPSETF